MWHVFFFVMVRFGLAGALSFKKLPRVVGLAFCSGFGYLVSVGQEYLTSTEELLRLIVGTPFFCV